MLCLFVHQIIIFMGISYTDVDLCEKIHGLLRERCKICHVNKGGFCYNKCIR